MDQALAPPFLIATGVLLVAALAKLRSPAAAARALAVLGVPGGHTAVRLLAAGELALAGWCLVAPSRAGAAATAALYIAFAAVALVLARRRQSCGCFGGEDTPASPSQALLSSALALVCAAAAGAGAHGVAWVGHRGAAAAMTLGLAMLAGVYGAVLVYTQLPQAWEAWSAR